MKRINEIINRYFGVILLLASLTALLIPELHVDINLVIMLALGFIIFISFFKVNIDKDLFVGQIQTVSVFFLFRFVIIPVVVFYITGIFSMYYAIVMFLLLLMPAAVSSPAFANMFDGNIGLALKILVISSFFSIFSVPFLSRVVLSRNTEINTTQMFLTMVYTIVVPFLLHLPFRRSNVIKKVFTANSPLLTITGLIAIYVVATVKNREMILQDPLRMILYFIIALAVFIILYLLGFYGVKNKPVADRFSYSICSGANNVGLGVTITALFFSQEINLFFIVCQLAWIAALIPIRYFFYRQG